MTPRSRSHVSPLRFQLVTREGLAAISISVVLGAALASEGSLGWLLAGACLALLTLALILAYTATPHWQLEIPLTLLLTSTLVWRVRDVSAITSQPLDPAGLLRVALLCTAAGLALLSVPLQSTARFLRGASLPYLMYALVALVSALLATHIGLALFRAAELALGIFIVAAAVASDPDHWRTRALRVLLGFTSISLLIVFLEAVIVPDLALRPISDYGPFAAPFNFRLEGVFPHAAANTVGTYGVFLILLTIYAAHSRFLTSRIRAVLLCLGVAAVLLSQYRTGYLALAGVSLLLALVNRRYRSAAVLAVLGIVLTAAFVSPATFVEPIRGLLFRGQTPEMLTSLTGREQFWDAALTVWAQSPWFGLGLSSGTRFDVLAHLGYGTVSTIHSTWIEALVGTGLLGISLLASAFAFTCFQAFRLRLLFPMMVLVALLVRSTTGTTVELMGYQAVLFAIAVHWTAAPQRVNSVPQPREGEAVSTLTASPAASEAHAHFARPRH